MIRNIFDEFAPKRRAAKRTHTASAEEAKGEKATTPQEDLRPAKEIFMPSAEERRILKNMTEYYPLATLEDKFAPCFQFARKYRLYYLDENGKEQCPLVISKVAHKENILKKDTLEFLAIMRYYRNLHYYLDKLSEGEKAAMEKVIADHYVTFTEAEKILGEKCTAKEKRAYYEKAVLKPKLAFWYSQESVLGNETGEYYNFSRVHISHLALNEGQRYDLMRVLHPETFHPQKLDELPAGEQLLTYNNEQQIHTILPMLQVMYKTRQIDFGSNKCTATTVKKVANVTGIREFFESSDKEGSRLASLLLTNVYCLNAMGYGLPDLAVEDNIKYVWTYVQQENCYLPGIILNHITGFRKNQMEYCECKMLCLDIVYALKAYGAEGKWLEAENLCEIIRSQSAKSESHCLWVHSYEFDKMKLKNTYNEQEILAADIMRELTYPFLRGMMFMLAAFGMAEIAYTPAPSPDATCFYETLRYVRLTPLGQYVLGLSKKYKQPNTPIATQLFELYDDNLMVKSLTEQNPYESALGSMATAVSKHLYKASYDTFLTGCTCKSDITNKIQLFRDYVCKEPPANWEQFFREMEDRCKLLKAPQKKYSLLQIPTDRKDLQRIVLSDPVIRKYSLKAEGFILLVETSNKGKVVEALKKYGYLI